MKRQADNSHSKGFALVITLSLMILLTLMVVGLLSLSTISLRSAAQGEAMATAQSNARLALILAIGDLQKSLGPDRAVCASSEILTTTPAKPHTTGVWQSWWDFNPANSSSLNYSNEKQKRFRRWLVSNADRAAVESRDFATTEWSGKTIELVGENTLGGKAAASAKVVAGLVPVTRKGKAEGAYAWHVADEAAKARINLYRDPSQNTSVAQQRALLAGQRPDPSVMTDTAGTLLDCLPTDKDAAAFKAATASFGKLTDLAQVDLYGTANGKIKPLRHDLTTWSLGVLSNVRSGGLKQDLSCAFEINGTNGTTTLPGDFPSDFTGGTRARLYASTPAKPGAAAAVISNGISDPNWSTLSSYYNSFRNLSNPEGGPLLAQDPRNPLESPISTPVPTRYNPAPVIAKVDTIFSLVIRPASDVYWLDHTSQNNGALDNYDYFVNMIFTPVVTLHNPYNVNISFYRMNLTFLNVPVAFNFMLDKGGTGSFLPQSVVPDTFEAINEMAGTGSKTFGINIANWTDTQPYTKSQTISGPIVMKPGQSLICGPNFPPDSSFKSDAAAEEKVVAFDWGGYAGTLHITNTIKAKPSFIPGLGFETYGVTPAHTLPGAGMGSWCSFLFLRDGTANSAHPTDRFYVKFKAQQPGWPSDNTLVPNKLADPSFVVSAQLQPTENAAITDNYAQLKFDYKNDTTLKNFFNNREYRYPPTDSLTGSANAAPGGIAYSQQAAYTHPFAIFSAYARTTNGGTYETGLRTPGSGVNLLRDGRLAGKPFLFHNPSRGDVTMNLASDKPGVQAYELNLQPFLSKGDYQDYMDVDGNRVPALTGNTTTRGIKSGSYLEVPSGPMQTIADFRRSNALTTSYLPNTVQPVGNSLASPLIATDKVRQTDSDISSSELLDHSVLANHALYDRFYFSTIATRGSETPDAVFEKFMDGSVPLASQGFQPYRPGGKSVAASKADLFASGKPKDDAYKTAAEYQMLQGPFNVNSTSIQAWKAVLASMNKSNIVTLWARANTIELTKAVGVPVLGMSLLNGGVTGATADASKIDDAKTNDWNGHRELTDSELTTLATSIVAQVRSRGPFLSMSDFVNRQIGPNSPLTRSGALEAAITDSKINDNFFKTHVTDIGLTDICDAKLYKYNTPEVVTGNPAAGAPGWISQGDLLRILEPAATVRGDTFVIRVCGEAWDAGGKVSARAYAEAVVQRIPEYVDPLDRPSLNVCTDATAAKANQSFGRHISVVSFRWLSKNEI
ncbi:MAG: pilus assembly PilX N-terminal domain-containing protein [Verrucomicrobiota bacterium]